VGNLSLFDNQKYGCSTLLALCCTRGIIEIIMRALNL